MNFRLRSRAAVAVALVFLTPAATRAEIVLDEIGDLLPTHAGPANGDLDIAVAGASYDGRNIGLFTGQLDPIGFTPGITFVWGINRGAGQAGLFEGLPAVGGPGVLFDAVVVITGDGRGSVTAFNDGAPPTTTILALDRIAIEISIVAASVPLDLLPSRGFAIADYTYNLWTRSGGGQTGIADLARDTGNFTATAVPEPATWALLIAGFAAVGIVRRRQLFSNAT